MFVKNIFLFNNIHILRFCFIEIHLQKFLLLANEMLIQQKKPPIYHNFNIIELKHEFKL